MPMSIEEKKRLIKNLDNLIRAKTPGTAKDMAKKLKISRSTFYRLLDYFRVELDAPVVFDRDMKRYRYEEEGVIFIGFIPSRILTKESLVYLKK